MDPLGKPKQHDDMIPENMALWLHPAMGSARGHIEIYGPETYSVLDKSGSAGLTYRF